MRLPRFLCSVLLVQSFLTVASAQQSTPTAQNVPTSPELITQKMRKTVGFLRIITDDGPPAKGVVGTCFFVLYEDKRVGPEHPFIYLVTNHHVAEPGIDLSAPLPPKHVFLSLNLKPSNGETRSEEKEIPLSDKYHFYFPDDPSSDLAVFPFFPPFDLSAYDLAWVPTSLFATPEIIKSWDINAADPVMFTGYFSNFHGEKRLEPIIRQGVLAMMPEEKLGTTLHQLGKVYLADIHAFHGNSGSPLFVSVGGIRHSVMRMTEGYFLLGVVSGYYPESAEFSVPAANVLTGEVRDNSGITTVVPVDQLLSLLESDQVKKLRDSQIAVILHKP